MSFARERSYGRTVSIAIAPSSTWGTWTVTFRTEALPGTLAALAGTLTAAGLDIGSAMVSASSEGWVTDTFDVSPREGVSFGVADSDRLARMATDVLDGVRDIRSDIADLRRSHTAPQQIAPRVEVREDSTLTTGINIVCADRPGLLHDITKKLSDYGLRTRSLSVITFNGRAHDTFRVVDSEGRPPTNGQALEALRMELRAICA